MVPPAWASACQFTGVSPRLAVAGDDGERRRQAAVGDRDAGGCGRADGRTDAGHHLAGDALLGERDGLLAAAAEHEGVAALQAHDSRCLRGRGGRAAR